MHDIMHDHIIENPKCDMENISLKFKCKPLEYLFQESQWKKAKIKVRLISLLGIVGLLIFIVIELTNSQTGFKNYLELISMLLVMTSIEFGLTYGPKIRWLNGVPTILVTYVGMIEYSIGYYHSVLIPPT